VQIDQVSIQQIYDVGAPSSCAPWRSPRCGAREREAAEIAGLAAAMRADFRSPSG
jgi:hypothetical protein